MRQKSDKTLWKAQSLVRAGLTDVGVTSHRDGVSHVDATSHRDAMTYPLLYQRHREKGLPFVPGFERPCSGSLEAKPS